MKNGKTYQRTLLTTLALGACMSPCLADEAVTITLTEKPLVQDVSRFGINLGKGSPQSLSRVRCMNFEGMQYRQSHIGVLHTNSFVSFNGKLDGSPKDYKAAGWADLVVGSEATILSGPCAFQKVKIAKIEAADIKIWGQAKKGKQCVRFVFDKNISLPEGTPIEGAGFMIDVLKPNAGAFPIHDHKHWSGHVKVVQGDVPSESFGNSALLMMGSGETKKGAFFRLNGQDKKVVDLGAKWHMSFWAKKKSGSPSVSVRMYGSTEDVSVGSEWAKFEVALDIENDEKGDTGVWVNQGDILLDDLTFWKEEEKDNPTVFSDELVSILQNLNPGIIRTLQMGGASMEQMLRPVLQTYAAKGGLGSIISGKIAPKGGLRTFSMNEYYTLAKHLHTEPWLCLPGTLHIEEIDQFMEFIGGDSDTEWGKIRAEQGQEKPWTESLRKIHVEFGNETWNFFGPYVCGGYDGPDYWKALIARAKQSPYYTPNIIFHVSGRGWAGYAKPSEEVTNADCFTWAPYIIHKMSTAQEEALDTDEKTYQWIFGEGVHYARKAQPRVEKASALGAELSIYEINHHITAGNASDDAKNKIVTSAGSGLSVTHSMLVWMKENHARNQCFFKLEGNYYQIRLWGGMLGMKKGAERYRPTWLALEAANKVVGGDLVETTHSADEPTFVPLSWPKGKGVTEFAEGEPLPTVWSYAFADGKKRGLILMNLDIANSQNVILKMDGTIAGDATQWVLDSEKVSDNNEWEAGDDTPVNIVESQIKGFKTGHQLTLPAHSMTTLRWTIK